MVKKNLIVLIVVLMLGLMVALPVSADSEDALHPEHCPGEGAPHNHPIPPGYAGAEAPGPLAP